MQERESSHVLMLILLGIACVLGAIVIAYPFLYVEEPSAVVVLTDGGSGTGETEPSLLVNINTATEDELQELQGIGPVLAKRILEYRQENGNFEQLEDLKNVSGIGEKTFEKIRSQITLGDFSETEKQETM